MKTLLSVLFLSLFLVLLLGLSFILYEEKVVLFRSRAQVVNLSRQNSFTFGLPACGKAGNDGQSVRLNIVALTDSGLGKSNIECKVVTAYAQELSVRAIQGITDTYGKALFDISATNPGIYEVKVLCDDTIINDRQKLCFE